MTDPQTPSFDGHETAFAHTLPGRPPSDWQLLEDHLHQVAASAEQSAALFQAEAWGRLAGLWHDLGKYSLEFQRYLRAAGDVDGHQAESADRIDHSTAGAQLAASRFEVLGHLLAFVISGHHSGLLDTQSDRACLVKRLEKDVPSVPFAPAALLDQPCPDLPSWLGNALAHRDTFSIQFFVRMVFSCLVDADFLDTETFMSPARSRLRPSWPNDILERMRGALDERLLRFGEPSTPVEERRAEVLEACRAAADRSPGLFTLTVPTGGGKTLSSLAFALSHAIEHRLERIVYVVPFTSIIEQNAAEFQATMSPLVETGLPDPVVEHHSNMDPDKESVWSRLATENWDAPLVVTTSVQFYESMFSNRTSGCRKLHNLASSVIILDEAQALPVDYLEPCLRALRELTEHYGSTIVLCTATQPAVRNRDGFDIGLEIPPEREIIPDPATLYRELRRVRVEREERIVADAELAEWMGKEHQALCIVNTRRHALSLFDLLPEQEGHFHLSGLMCPAHRSSRLAEIRRRLEGDCVCRVVSTQLVEAGVDLDFPVVYRSMAGIDSIAQAAGRCNRNGRTDTGRTVVFDSEHRSSEAFLRDTAASAREVLALHEDPLSLDAVEQYFRLYYWDQQPRWDAQDILKEFYLNQDRDAPFLFGFARAAGRFRLIEDMSQSVIIPWGDEGERLCVELREAWKGPPVQLRRRLQRYTVGVPRSAWGKGLAGAFEVVHDQYPILISPDLHYSESTGLRLDADLTEALAGL